MFHQYDLVIFGRYAGVVTQYGTSRRGERLFAYEEHPETSFGEWSLSISDKLFPIAQEVNA